MYFRLCNGKSKYVDVRLRYLCRPASPEKGISCGHADFLYGGDHPVELGGGEGLMAGQVEQTQAVVEGGGTGGGGDAVPAVDGDAELFEDGEVRGRLGEDEGEHVGGGALGQLGRERAAVAGGRPTSAAGAGYAIAPDRQQRHARLGDAAGAGVKDQGVEGHALLR
jgi:hypothetical protein